MPRFAASSAVVPSPLPVVCYIEENYNHMFSKIIKLQMGTAEPVRALSNERCSQDTIKMSPGSP